MREVMVVVLGRTTMNRTIQCAHCGCHFVPNPRVKNQAYCRQKDCQRARKRKWQREKLSSDPDYRANQRDCQRQWHQRHPGYFQEYRQRHRASTERNRLMQRYRNRLRRPPEEIATMDAFHPTARGHPAIYYLLPWIAKMDASAQKVLIIPIC